jgi:hypothetical protein
VTESSSRAVEQSRRRRMLQVLDFSTSRLLD